MIKEILPLEKQTTETRAWNVLENTKLAAQISIDLTDTLKSIDRLWLTTTELGIEERAIAVKFKDEVHVFLNPAMQFKDKMILFREVCPVDNKEYFIPRYTDMSLAYQDVIGDNKAVKLNEASAIVVSQALDGLNCVYACDYGLEIIPEFDEASEEDKKEVLSEYVNNLASAYKVLDSELMEDSETSRYWQDAKFIKSVAEGETVLEEKPKSNREKKRLAKTVEQVKQYANRMKYWRKKK